MLLSSVQTPHSELVGALYRDHRGWLLAWLRRNVACPQRAEDLSQDTFVRLLGRADLKAPREPRAFLAAIAKGLLSEDDYLLQEILFNPRTPSQVENIRLELKNLLEIISNKDAEGMKKYLTKIREKIR